VTFKSEHRGNSCQRKHPTEMPPWSLRQKIALTCRILAAEGHESALAGQITARGDRPGTYWMLSKEMEAKRGPWPASLSFR
jgi:L-fuculose-phosphate aldolase